VPPEEVNAELRMSLAEARSAEGDVTMKKIVGYGSLLFMLSQIAFADYVFYEYGTGNDWDIPARAGLPHDLDENTVALVRNVGEWTAGMIRLAKREERDYIEQSLSGFVRDDDPEVTKLVLGLVAQEIQMRQHLLAIARVLEEA
jgi:hypothetical protein